MKLAPLLLINLLLIGGALYLYDSLRTPPRREQVDAVDAYDPLRADDLAIGGEDERTPAPAMLEGGGSETHVLALIARIESLEGDVVRLRRALAARATGGGGDDGAMGSGGGGAALPAIELDDVGDLEDPQFDERALGSIEAYLDEINRRKAVERQRGIVGAQLTRLGIELSDDQRQQVIAETLAYQKRATEVSRAGWPKDEAGRDQRRETFKALHAEYETKINRLVPADTAEKITSSRLARSRGFISGAAPRVRGGRDRGRNRNPDR